MGPGNGRGLGSSGGAVLMALVVAVVVLIMVKIGGGLTRPLIEHRSSVALAPAAARGQG